MHSLESIAKINEQAGLKAARKAQASGKHVAVVFAGLNYLTHSVHDTRSDAEKDLARMLDWERGRLDHATRGEILEPLAYTAGDRDQSEDYAVSRTAEELATLANPA